MFENQLRKNIPNDGDDWISWNLLLLLLLLNILKNVLNKLFLIWVYLNNL